MSTMREILNKIGKCSGSDWSDKRIEILRREFETWMLSEAYSQIPPTYQTLRTVSEKWKQLSMYGTMRNQNIISFSEDDIDRIRSILGMPPREGSE